jgi:type II secretory pathway pseudopilin PulG
MTLVEMLAVVVIVTLIATTVSVSLAAADSSAQFLKALSTVRGTNYRARIHARTAGEVVVMTVNAGRLRCSMAGEVIMDHQLPPDLNVEMVTDAGGNGITIDRQGRSDDYQVIIGSGNRQRQWQVCGLTGLVVETETNR